MFGCIVVGCTQPKPFNNGRLKEIHLQPVKKIRLGCNSKFQ